MQFSVWLQVNGYPPHTVLKHLQWAEHEVMKNSSHRGVGQLDTLLILHIMMFISSEEDLMADGCSKEQFSLQSVGYCLHIWKVSDSQ